jgi:hypothetical protein
MLSEESLFSLDFGLSASSEDALPLGPSIVGTLALALWLFLIETLLYKLGVHKS